MPLAPKTLTPPAADALTQRTGLPEAFRYLEAACPRAQWPTLPIAPMAQHWLDVHRWFRAQTADLVRLGALWREGQTDAAQYRAASAPRLRQLLTNLHHHHTLETQHAFPQMAAAEPRMAAGFDLLDRDHDLIDARLAELADSANALLRALSPTPVLAETLADRLEATTTLIGRHLDDEEEIVVPVLTLRGEGFRL